MNRPKVQPKVSSRFDSSICSEVEYQERFRDYIDVGGGSMEDSKIIELFLAGSE